MARRSAITRLILARWRARRARLAGEATPSRQVRGQAGVASVEFALLAPLLLAIMLGVISYSMYFTVLIAVTEAAAVGARASVAGLDCQERQSLASGAVTNFFASYGGFLAPVTPVTSCNGGSFQVRVTYNIASLNLGMMAGFVPVPTTSPSATVTVSTGGL